MKTPQRILRDEMSRWIIDTELPFDDYFSLAFSSLSATAMQTIVENAMVNHAEQYRKKTEPVNKEGIKTVLEIMNKVCKTSFKPTSKASWTHIGARLAEGFTVYDFELVINDKQKNWGNDEKMRQFLRPQTLFAGKFESYLQEAKRNLPAPAIKHIGFNGEEI